jgi:hypothetical protein
MTLLFCWLLFQDIDIQHLPPGNQVYFGEFVLTVPEGAFLAIEEDAEPMYPLIKLHHLNKGVGVFFDANANWDWGIAVQYYPNEVAISEIPLEPSVVADTFSTQNHLFFLEPLEGESATTVIMPPQWSDDRTSFELGIHYDEGKADQLGYFLKKAFFGKQGTLVFSARIQEDAYIDRIETVERVFNETVGFLPVEETSTPPDLELKPYIQFFGMQFNPEVFKQNFKRQQENLVKQIQENAAKREEEEPIINFWLLGGAVALLAIAFIAKSAMNKG